LIAVLFMFIVGWGNCPPLWMFLFMPRMRSRKPSYKVSGMFQRCEGGVSYVCLLTFTPLWLFEARTNWFCNTIQSTPSK